MEKTRQQYGSSEEREFKLLVRRDAVTGGLSVAASSSGAWASNISLGISDEGTPCCTAVIAPGPDMQGTAAGALQPEDEFIEDDELIGSVIEQTAEKESDSSSATVDERTAREADKNASTRDGKPERGTEQLEGRPFEEIAKGAAKKASGAKPAGSKQSSKPVSSSGRQPSRTVSGGQQAAARR